VTVTVVETPVQTAAEAVSDDEGTEIWDIDEPHKLTPDFANRTKTPMVPSEAVLVEEPVVERASVVSVVNNAAMKSILGSDWLANKRQQFYANLGIPLPAKYADKEEQHHDAHPPESLTKQTISDLIDHAQPDPRDKLRAFLCNTEPEEANPQKATPEPLKDAELAFLEEDMESVECSSSASRWTELNPFTIHNLPDRYFEIRRIIFTEVRPEIYGISGIFSQISCGLIQSVTYDRENGIITVLFVEALSAREQFIRWFNRGVTLPPGEIGKCDDNPGNNITLPLGIFVWTPESEPMDANLRKSIYDSNATRVLALTGKVDELDVEKFQQEILAVIYEDSRGHNLDFRDVFESIETRMDPPRMLIKFTGLKHSVLIRRFIRENQDYAGIEVRFGKDPCDYKDLTSKLKAAGVLDDPAKAQELFGTRIGTSPLVFDDSYVDPDDLPLGPHDSQFDPQFQGRLDSQFDSQLESQYLKPQSPQAEVGVENMPGNNAQGAVPRTPPAHKPGDRMMQDRMAVQPFSHPVPDPTALTHVVKEEETEGVLREMWDRGLIGERSLMAKGLLPKEEPKWEAPDEDEDPVLPLTPVFNDQEPVPMQYPPFTPRETPAPIMTERAPAALFRGSTWPVQTLESATSQAHWSSGETHAIRAYRAAQKEKLELSSPQRLTPLTPPVAPKPAAPSSFKGEPRHFSARTVLLIGLPNKTTYPELGRYIKGGPVDTIRINEHEHSALVIFVYAKDMQAYQKFLQTTDIKIRGNKLMPMKPQQKYLIDMSLREPEEILARGWTRCIFLEGLPLGITTDALRRDLNGIVGIKLDYQKIEVQGLCARVWTTAITTALALREGLRTHYKYTGVHFSFEMDPCDAHPMTINR
jgi:hypothetical protein